jgi:competence protein ComEC
MTKSRIFLYFCLSFIGGIFLNSVITISQLLMLSFLILGIFLISVFWKYKKIVVIGFCLLFLIAGIWRCQVVESRIIDSELGKYNDREEIITITGVVKSEPDVREDNIKLIIEPDNIEGKVLVTTDRYPEYRYGDKLKIKGYLETPPVFEDFNYKNYLAKEGIYSVMYRPKIELQEREKYLGVACVFYEKILDFKNKLRETIYQDLSPPQSSILGAIVLGDKRKISEEYKQKLNIAGVRHITAISGMHVAILTSILMTFLLGLGVRRGQAFYFTIFLIFLFILMTGFQSSAVRAGIMGGLLLLGQKLGRLSVSSRAIIFAAALMLAINPLLLTSDVGFQLSFLAMMGIIYLMPTFKSWFKKIPNLFQFRNILAMTLSAQVFTLPILIYNFGYISLVSPLTNILIVPALPYIMGFGFIFSILGILWQPLGWVLSWPAWFLLTYVVKIVDWFSSFSWASITLEVSWSWFIIFYLILASIIWKLQKRKKLRFLNY